MTHIPFGYRMINGTIRICEAEAAHIRDLYDAYLDGASIIKAGRISGLSFPQRTVNNMLSDPVYVQNTEYPRILDPAVFTAAQEERKRRWQKQPHRTTVPEPPQPVNHTFVFHEERLSAIHTKDPQELISILYACIESSDYGTAVMHGKERKRIRQWLKDQMGNRRKE